MRRRKRAEKVDLSNSDRREVYVMIASYKSQSKQEIPLRINEKLTVFVSPEKCNERYRQQYIRTHK